MEGGTVGKFDSSGKKRSSPRPRLDLNGLGTITSISEGLTDLQRKEKKRREREREREVEAI